MALTAVRVLWRLFAKRIAASVRKGRSEARAVTASGAGPGVMKSAGLAFAMILLATDLSSSGVLSDSDFRKIEEIKPMFQNLMGDLMQTSKRTDISGGDADCIKATVQELLQISAELSSYEYLMTMEKDMTDFGDNNPMRGIVKFAAEKSNTILTSERKRIAQLSDQCTRFPLSFGKMQQALQVIDATTGILKSIQVRL
jgi:hypothetical protein